MFFQVFITVHIKLNIPLDIYLRDIPLMANFSNWFSGHRTPTAYYCNLHRLGEMDFSEECIQ
jgi:hypothetical protein